MIFTLIENSFMMSILWTRMRSRTRAPRWARGAAGDTALRGRQCIRDAYVTVFVDESIHWRGGKMPSWVCSVSFLSWKRWEVWNGNSGPRRGNERATRAGLQVIYPAAAVKDSVQGMLGPQLRFWLRGSLNTSYAHSCPGG